MAIRNCSIPGEMPVFEVVVTVVFDADIGVVVVAGFNS